jgi:hypothetical protein
MRTFAIAVGVSLVAMSSLAEAQWVMLARHVVGRVEQMSQQSPQAGGASYDSAAVMLDAPPNKVYSTVLRGLQNAQGITITREVPTDGLVEFTNGQQVAGIKVSGIGEQLTHMMITSAHTGNQANAAALVLNGVLRVCKQMNVECSQAKQ